MIARRIRRDERGVAVLEMALALPALIVLIWGIAQLGMVYRAMSGIQHALGEGARLATIFPTPSIDAVTQRIEDKVYGIGPGTFEIDDPAVCPGFMILNVTYTQPTDLLLFPGPTITVARSKRVWVASEDFGEASVVPDGEVDPCA